MGATYTFQCPSCGFSEDVSGGEDSGFFTCTATILCEVCQRLYDVPTGERTGDEVAAVVPCCPVSSQHTCKTWEHPDSCPRCGTIMDRSEIILNWD